METECVCPYCKKKFVVDVVVKHNEYFLTDKPPVISEVGVSRYIEKE